MPRDVGVARFPTAEAANEEDLKRAQAMMGHRIEAFGRREHLTVTWH